MCSNPMEGTLDGVFNTACKYGHDNQVSIEVKKSRFGTEHLPLEYYVERNWHETRLMKLAPISQKMALNYIAEHVLCPPHRC